MRSIEGGISEAMESGFLAGYPMEDVKVIVHDGSYVSRGPRPGPIPRSMTTAPRRLAGQSGHGRGALLLDWRTVVRQIERPERGSNVVVHEFAHKLDQLTGAADGMPPLPSRTARDAWIQTIGTNFRRLRRRGSDDLVFCPHHVGTNDHGCANDDHHHDRATFYDDRASGTDHDCYPDHHDDDHDQSAAGPGRVRR